MAAHVRVAAQRRKSRKSPGGVSSSVRFCCSHVRCDGDHLCTFLELRVRCENMCLHPSLERHSASHRWSSTGCSDHLFAGLRCWSFGATRGFVRRGSHLTGFKGGTAVSYGTAGATVTLFFLPNNVQPHVPSRRDSRRIAHNLSTLRGSRARFRRACPGAARRALHLGFAGPSG